MAIVYRLYDAAGELLYVGMSTRHVKRRVGEHMASQPWGEEIETWTFEEYATRAEAFTAETKAIRADMPLWNSESPLYDKATRAEWTEAQWRRFLVNCRRKRESIDVYVPEFRERYRQPLELVSPKLGNSWIGPRYFDFVGPEPF